MTAGPPSTRRCDPSPRHTATSGVPPVIPTVCVPPGSPLLPGGLSPAPRQARGVSGLHFSRGNVPLRCTLVRFCSLSVRRGRAPGGAEGDRGTALTFCVSAFSPHEEFFLGWRSPQSRCGRVGTVPGAVGWSQQWRDPPLSLRGGGRRHPGVLRRAAGTPPCGTPLQRAAPPGPCFPALRPHPSLPPPAAPRGGSGTGQAPPHPTHPTHAPGGVLLAGWGAPGRRGNPLAPVAVGRRDRSRMKPPTAGAEPPPRPPLPPPSAGLPPLCRAGAAVWATVVSSLVPGCG